MRAGIFLFTLVLLLVPGAFAQQDAVPPVSIAAPVWHVDHRHITKQDNGPTRPQRELTSDDKYYAREKRDNAMRGSAPLPSDMTPDGAREKMDKAVDSANSPGDSELTGFFYQASFVNNTKKTVAVIYWEYRFTELANPSNVVRRQFLCSANMKPAAKKDLWIFTPLGPSTSISADSLKTTTGPVFDEKIYINRIEFTDDSILQRGNWKLEDVKSGVANATSTPWGNEVCRAI